VLWVTNPLFSSGEAGADSGKFNLGVWFLIGLLFGVFDRGFLRVGSSRPRGEEGMTSVVFRGDVGPLLCVCWWLASLRDWR